MPGLHGLAKVININATKTFHRRCADVAAPEIIATKI